MKEIWTIRSLISWTTQYFSDKGCQSPRLDAEILLAHTLKCQRIDLYLNPDKPVQATERELFREYVKRRAAREPVAYIIGSKEFWSLEFLVDENVLIPRPETEELLGVVIERLSDIPNPLILDLGTGSGCISVVLARELSSAMIIAVDTSPKAINIARRNAENHSVSDRITFVHSHWFDAMSGTITENSLTAIVSNPPYISRDQYETLQPEIVSYEPEIALVGGDDGLDAYRSIVGQSHRWLTRNGWVFFEIGDEQNSKVENILAEHHFKSIESMKDASGRYRIVMGKRDAGTTN